MHCSVLRVFYLFIFSVKKLNYQPIIKCDNYDFIGSYCKTYKSHQI